MKLENLLGEMARHPLIWMQTAGGVGFFDCDAFNEEHGVPHIYDQAYFDNYAALCDTPIAAALNAFRVSMLWLAASNVNQDSPRRISVLDVGVGDGAFLRAAAGGINQLQFELRGCDINPAALAYLSYANQMGSLKEGADIVCCWDSLEHFRDPREPLRAARQFALVSLPTFETAAEAAGSKHFKPEEHFWYFSEIGFRLFAIQEGFEVLRHCRTETELGREGISTFILKRRETL